MVAPATARFMGFGRIHPSIHPSSRIHQECSDCSKLLPPHAAKGSVRVTERRTRTPRPSWYAVWSACPTGSVSGAYAWTAVRKWRRTTSQKPSLNSCRRMSLSRWFGRRSSGKEHERTRVWPSSRRPNSCSCSRSFRGLSGCRATCSRTVVCHTRI